MKSDEIRAEIERLRQLLAVSEKRMRKLEDELKIVVDQESDRCFYVSSKEIIDIMESNTGRTVDMSTIKRWSDKGHLGEVYNEKRKFWALDVGSGKQRNLYERKKVMNFLYNRGYIKPKFSILDYVAVLSRSAQLVGTVVRHELDINGFTYSVQLDESVDIINQIPEQQLKGIC